MTLSIFMSLVTILAMVSSLFTEAIKKNFKIKNSTLFILIVSLVVGWAGGAMTYSFIGVPFNDVNNILCLVLLGPAIWLCATLGYDKIKEVIMKIGETV
jgi:hypothetical protein